MVDFETGFTRIFGTLKHTWLSKTIVTKHLLKLKTIVTKHPWLSNKEPPTSPEPRHGGGDGPQGSWIIIIIGISS